MSPSRRRVVITGMGVISPLGNTTQSLWQSLIGGRSGVGPLTLLPPDALPVSFAAEARQFQGTIDNFGPLEKEQTKAIRKGLKVMCRECQMGVAVAQLAMSDAKLTPGSFEPDRVGISFGCDYMTSLPEEFSEGIVECLREDGGFDFSRWATHGMPKMSPLWLLKYLPNMPASHVAIYNDLRGPNNSLTLREAAANVAVAEAYQQIVQGRAGAMVVGATGTRLHPLKTVHAVQQEEIATGPSPERASRPFDRDRSGMVLGEGAGAVVLEELKQAQQRGATIFAEVLGGASSSAADANLAPRCDKAMKNALLSTLSMTGTSPDDVGFLVAHGLSTRQCDAQEAWAIGQVFGCRSQPLPVVAPKSNFGNLGAGSGMVELVAGVIALREGLLFPAFNYETPDPECPVSVVTSETRLLGKSFVNMSVTPQGQASAALIATVRN